MPKVSVPKATTAIVSLLVVACVFTFARWFSARLAANSIIAALFLLLVVLVTIAGRVSRKSWRRGTPGRRLFLRYAVPGLLVLLAPALVWALFGTSFQGLVTMLPTGSITLNSPNDVIVDSQGNVYIADTHNNQIVEVTAFGVIDSHLPRPESGFAQSKRGGDRRSGEPLCRRQQQLPGP